jgi:DNA-binding phage protein
MSKAKILDATKYRNNPKVDCTSMMRLRPIIALLPPERSATSRAPIAEEVKVDRTGLYRSLSGEMDPRFGTVLKVLAALGVQLVAKQAA